MVATPLDRPWSHAQNGEDLRLWQALWPALKDVGSGFYVDVGAGHPRDLSVTLAFYELGWHGINIEPDGEMYKLLSAERPRDINLHLAAGPSLGVASFYYFQGAGFCANKPEIRSIFEAAGHKGHEAILAQDSLNNILTIHPPLDDQIHFLKIDVEGYEREVLEGIDLWRYRPWIIVVEATLPSTKIRSDHLWDTLILSHGYKFACFDELNCFYVAQEHADLGPYL